MLNENQFAEAVKTVYARFRGHPTWAALQEDAVEIHDEPCEWGRMAIHEGWKWYVTECQVHNQDNKHSFVDAVKIAAEFYLGHTPLAFGEMIELIDAVYLEATTNAKEG